MRIVTIRAQFSGEPLYLRVCGFCRIFKDTLFYHFQQQKVHINDLDFRHKSRNLILDGFSVNFRSFGPIFSRTGDFPDMRISQDVETHLVLPFSARKSTKSMARFSSKVEKRRFLKKKSQKLPIFGSNFHPEDDK